MRITLVYSPCAREVQEGVLDLPQGSRLAQALAQCDWLARWPELAEASTTVGVWGKPVGRDHLLRDGDRVEIYRALTVDPKVARRERFAQQGSRAAGLFARPAKTVRPGT